MFIQELLAARASLQTRSGKSALACVLRSDVENLRRSSTAQILHDTGHSQLSAREVCWLMGIVARAHLPKCMLYFFLSGLLAALACTAFIVLRSGMSGRLAVYILFAILGCICCAVTCQTCVFACRLCSRDDDGGSIDSDDVTSVIAGWGISAGAMIVAAMTAIIWWIAGPHGAFLGLTICFGALAFIALVRTALECCCKVGLFWKFIWGYSCCCTHRAAVKRQRLRRCCCCARQRGVKHVTQSRDAKSDATFLSAEP